MRFDIRLISLYYTDFSVGYREKLPRKGLKTKELLNKQK